MNEGGRLLYTGKHAATGGITTHGTQLYDPIANLECRNPALGIEARCEPRDEESATSRTTSCSTGSVPTSSTTTPAIQNPACNHGTFANCNVADVEGVDTPFESLIWGSTAPTAPGTRTTRRSSRRAGSWVRSSPTSIAGWPASTSVRVARSSRTRGRSTCTRKWPTCPTSGSRGPSTSDRSAPGAPAGRCPSGLVRHGARLGLRLRRGPHARCGSGRRLDDAAGPERAQRANLGPTRPGDAGELSGRLERAASAARPLPDARRRRGAGEPTGTTGKW